MTTMTIQVPGKAKNKLSEMVRELGGEIISVSSDTQIAKKAKIVGEIKQGLKEVRKIREGKGKSYSMSGLFIADNLLR